MTEKRFKLLYSQLDNGMFVDKEKQFEDIIIDKEYQKIGLIKLVDLLNKLSEENEQLKKELKRCKDWINSDKNDYELTLAFIKNKGYSLKDVLEYEKELQND